MLSLSPLHSSSSCLFMASLPRKQRAKPKRVRNRPPPVPPLAEVASVSVIIGTTHVQFARDPLNYDSASDTLRCKLEDPHSLRSVIFCDGQIVRCRVLVDMTTQQGVAFAFVGFVEPEEWYSLKAGGNVTRIPVVSLQDDLVGIIDLALHGAVVFSVDTALLSDYSSGSSEGSIGEE
eukprot:TRINITY_DN18373_c0_g1_i1.p1 TRINITY_DN18373_c0_g1~~TRINITY_DN18373_c0_g1_i1.p1  ORF type:complete len:177 (+),score=14.99 TRINITY_DN18373_c0_g1_i1:136-666(+)